MLAISRTTVSRGWADFLYVTAGIPLGVTWTIVLATGLAVGLGTAIVTVGIPILAAMVALWRWGANTERERAALVLGAPIPRAHRPVSGRLIERWRGRMSDPATWKDLAYMLALGPVGLLAGGLVVGLWAAALCGLAAPAFSAAAPAGSLLARLSPAALAAGGVAAL